MEVAQRERNLKNKLSREILSCSLDKDDLRALCSILRERSAAAAEIEYQANRDNVEEEKLEQFRTTLNQAFDPRITIVGRNDEELFGTIEEVFDTPNFPEKVKSLYVSNETALRALHNYYPRNSFELLLDFSRPELFNLSLAPSASTPNNSRFVVQGLESTWANGVFHEVVNFIDQRSNSRKFIHKHSVFDVVQILVAFPIAFWICYRVSSWVESAFEDINRFMEVAAYVYVFIIILLGYRVLFDYARWVWPLVEYESRFERASRHRKVFGAVVISIAAMLVYDLFALVLS